MPESAMFNIALAFLVTHELDAVKQHEWRLLPVLNKLNDRSGFFWFTLLHIPLLLGVFQVYATSSPHSGSRLLLDAFCIVHVGLHILLRNHPLNTFNNPLSWSLIIGAATFAALDLGCIHLK
jgi:hypothetical protein